MPKTKLQKAKLGLIPACNLQAPSKTLNTQIHPPPFAPTPETDTLSPTVDPSQLESAVLEAGARHFVPGRQLLRPAAPEASEALRAWGRRGLRIKVSGLAFWGLGFRV